MNTIRIQKGKINSKILSHLLGEFPFPLVPYFSASSITFGSKTGRPGSGTVLLH